MITGISIVTVWVLDRDSAKKFYTDQLGFTLTNDIELESGMRWLTVRPPGSENQELLLLDPMHSMLDEETAQQVRALIAKGALSPGVWRRLTARLITRRWPNEASNSSRSQPNAPTVSRRCCATTRATGSASPSGRPEPGGQFRRSATGRGGRAVRVVSGMSLL
jgi:hypothetical protein